MRIWIEMELEATYHESNEGRVTLETIQFPECNQNILPFMNEKEKTAAQHALETHYEESIREKLIAIRERREMRGENHDDEGFLG